MRKTPRAPKPVFAENLSARAKILKMSGQMISMATDIPYPTVRDIMAGISEGGLENRRAIARALGMNLAEVYRESLEKPSYLVDLEQTLAGMAHQIERITKENEALRGHALKLSASLDHRLNRLSPKTLELLAKLPASAAPELQSFLEKMISSRAQLSPRGDLKPQAK